MKVLTQIIKKLFSCRVKRNKLIVRILFFKISLPYKNYFDSKEYGKIYFPYYSQGLKIENKKPDIYNAEGQRMDTFFIRDEHMSHVPYHSYWSSKYFLWDRFNIGLDTHFYTHRAMLETMGCPSKRYGMLVESEKIVPDDYRIFEKNQGLQKDFDLIFTYSERLLDKLSNARFVPFCASPWYGGGYGGIVSDVGYEKKDRNISIISSAKCMCELHKMRLAIAKKCKREGLADTFGTFDGGPMIKNGDALEKYRYAIVIENDISPLFFTERITSCFLAQTIPIYIGASRIGEFFNTEGIFQISPKDADNIEKVLKACDEQDYLQRLPAIKDNFERVKQYINICDWMYERYLR